MSAMTVLGPANDLMTRAANAALAAAISVFNEAALALKTLPVQKMRAYPLAWLHGFAQGLALSTDDEETRWATMKSSILHAWSSAQANAHAELWSRGLISREVIFRSITTGENEWTDVQICDEVLVPLDSSDSDHARVCERLLATMPLAHVFSVCRVELPELRHDFEQRCAELRERAARRTRRMLHDVPPFDGSSSTSAEGSDVLVLSLWHGTSKTAPDAIVHDEFGFDPRFARSGLWGRAAYFAKDARYSCACSSPLRTRSIVQHN